MLFGVRSDDLAHTFSTAEGSDTAIRESQDEVAFLIQIQGATEYLPTIHRGTNLASEQPAPFPHFADGFVEAFLNPADLVMKLLENSPA